MGKYFGTDGFRGEANIDLTVEHAYKVGRFLGWYFGKDHKASIVIGKDTAVPVICLSMRWFPDLRHPVQMPICCMLRPRQVFLTLYGLRILTAVL